MLKIRLYSENAIVKNDTSKSLQKLTFADDYCYLRQLPAVLPSAGRQLGLPFADAEVIYSLYFSALWDFSKT